MTMNADQVRQAALELAETAILDRITDPLVWQNMPAGVQALEDVEAIRVELRVIAEGVATKLSRLLPPPVQPVWAPVQR